MSNIPKMGQLPTPVLESPCVSVIFPAGSWALLLAEVRRFKTADLVSNPSQHIIIICIYILHTYNNLYPYMYYIYVYIYINIYAAFAVNSCAGQDLLLQDVFWDVHQGCSPSHLPPTTYPSFLSTCGSSKMSRANCLNMSEYEGNTNSMWPFKNQLGYLFPNESRIQCILCTWCRGCVWGYTASQKH